jgi:hypothetical protein
MNIFRRPVCRIRFDDLCSRLAPHATLDSPQAPHLNGKVDHSQQIDEMEILVTVDLTDPNLSSQLEEWQFFYN